VDDGATRSVGAKRGVDLVARSGEAEAMTALLEPTWAWWARGRSARRAIRGSRPASVVHEFDFVVFV
jgi:hypothetical protein